MNEKYRPKNLVIKWMILKVSWKIPKKILSPNLPEAKLVVRTITIQFHCIISFSKSAQSGTWNVECMNATNELFSNRKLKKNHRFFSQKKSENLFHPRQHTQIHMSQRNPFTAIKVNLMRSTNINQNICFFYLLINNNKFVCKFLFFIYFANFCTVAVRLCGITTDPRFFSPANLIFYPKIEA